MTALVEPTDRHSSAPCVALVTFLLLCTGACEAPEATPPAPEPTQAATSALMLGAPGRPGRSDQFVRSGSVLYWRYTEGRFTSAAAQHDYVWVGNRGVPLVSDPAAASWGTGRADVFVINQNQTIDHGGIDVNYSGPDFAWWDNWGTPSPGRPLVGISVSSGRAGLLDVFVVDASLFNGSNSLYHRRWDNGADSGWQYLGGPAVGWFSAPGAVSGGSNGPDSYDVFVKGRDGAIYHLSSPQGTSVFPWESLGVPAGAALVSSPTAASWGNGRIDVLATDAAGVMRHFYTGVCVANDHVYCTRFAWYQNSWTSPPVNKAPAMVATGPGMLRIFARAGDGSLLQCNWENADLGCSNLGGYIDGGPSASSWGLTPCDPEPSHAACPVGSGLACHYGVCVHPNWPPASVYSTASQQIASHPGEGWGGEWAVDWTNRLDGVAHDNNLWYFNNDKNIYVIPLHENIVNSGDWLDDYPSVTPGYVYLDSGWNTVGTFIGSFHFGDGDFYNGHLFMPIETTTDRPWGQFLAIFNAGTDHEHGLAIARQAQLLPLQMHFAWLAINPEDGTLYTATTFGNVSSLQTYKIGADLTATPDKVIPLHWQDGVTPLTLTDQVQGGAFSKNGHLYIVSGARDGSHGIYAFDTDGTLHSTLWFPFSTDGSEEMEGVDIVDLTGDGAVGMSGQIHAEKLNTYLLSNDALIFHHWNVQSPLY